jgi:hypothetical protein
MMSLLYANLETEGVADVNARRYHRTPEICVRDYDDEEVTCMSTLTIDDELYQRALEAAAVQGKTVEAFVGEALRQALTMVGVRRAVRNGLPVMVVSHDTPAIDPAKVRQCLEEEGF